MQPTMKVSSNVAKMSTPGVKQVWRITSNKDGKSEGDYVSFIEERPDQLNELFMFHPVHTYINKTVKDFTARPLLIDIYKEGQQVYDLPKLKDVKDYATYGVDNLWDEYKRILNPQKYPVDLSQKLYDAKMDSINDIRQYVQEIIDNSQKDDA